MTWASRHWRAVETTDPVGSEYRLTVTGQVETRRSNQVPQLVEAVPPGFNPETLILDLVVESHGDADEDVVE